MGANTVTEALTGPPSNLPKGRGRPKKMGVHQLQLHRGKERGFCMGEWDGIRTSFGGCASSG